MKLFDTIGEFLRTLFVPGEAPKKTPKPGAQTHGGFRDGFEKAAGQRVNLTGVAPAMIVVPEEKPDLTPQPDNDFVASLDDLPLDAAPPVEEAAAPSSNEAPPLQSSLTEVAVTEVARTEAPSTEAPPAEVFTTEVAATEGASTQAASTEPSTTAAESALALAHPVESEPAPDASEPPSDPQLQEKLHS